MFLSPVDDNITFMLSADVTLTLVFREKVTIAIGASKLSTIMMMVVEFYK